MGKELELAIKIGGKVDKSLGAAVNNAQQQLNSINKGINKAGAAVTAAVAAAGTKLVVDSIQTYKGYQSALNSAAATAGIERGTAEYEAMNAAAREAGRTTVKTAEESANALEYMALAGWSVTDSTKALMPILKLSASTGADLATTSDLVTDSMANLGLGINDLNHYLDVSATANNKSNQTAMQLQEAYLGVGGVLKNLNSPIEESAAVLGVLANRGTKGSEAGTALNAILVNMQKRSGDAYKAMSKLGVSMYDSSGKARSIIDVFQEISNKTSGMTEENRNLMYQMIGGKSHLDSFAKIMQGFTTDTADGTKEVYSLINAFNNCDGALDKLYGIKTDTLEGSLATLNSAFDDMKISIGEKLSPTLNNAVKDLTDKIPQIETIIVDALERIIPAASKVLDYLVNNSDKVIEGAMGIAKAFIAIRIGSGTVKGINNLILLGKNLSTLTKARGATTVLQGIIGTFTGAGTAAGTFSGAVTGAAASLITALAPVAAVTAGVIALGYAGKTAYDVWYKYNYKWGEGLEKQANAINTQIGEVVKLNDYKRELADLKLVINSPESSTEQVNNAQVRVKEIGDLLSKEYNLKINTDSGDLQQIVEDVTTITDALNVKARRETDQDIAKYLGNLDNTIDRYQSALTDLPTAQANLDKYKNQSEIVSGLLSSAVTQANAFDMSGDLDKYRNNMQTIATKLNDAGLLGKINEYMPKAINPEKLSEGLTDVDDLQSFLLAMHGADREISTLFNDADTKLTDTKNSIGQLEKSAKTTGNSLVELLASDVLTGNAISVENDIDRLEMLGTAMVEAGMSTSDIATKFAAAKVGYTDFAKAIGDGKAQEMAQNFIDYEKSIGETTETVVSGAALIANGFENVTQATAAGDEAISNVIANMKSLGDMQGIFDGLDNDGVADKLTDMAHAMELIPENKSITLDTDSNFAVIQEAENQIASLKAIGAVDVSINANGDLSVFNETTQEIQTLQGMGAVDVSVNAEGNIDVLDKAGEVIATIDSKNAQVSIDGQVVGMEAVQQAKAAADGLKDKTAVQTVSGTYNGQEVIATAIDYQNQLADVNKAQTVNGKFNGEKKIATALSYQSRLNNKDVTYTVTYVQNGKPPENNARGTASFRGGLTYVNDQNISDPREVIEYGGRRWWYEGKNVLTDLPHGARIYNAAQSRAFINGSHKNGLDRVPFDGYIAELHQGERVLTANEASNYNGGTFGIMLERLKEMLDELRGGGSNRGGGNNDSGGQIVFSPQITVNGNGDKETIMATMRMSYSEFREFMEEYERDGRRKSF